MPSIFEQRLLVEILQKRSGYFLYTPRLSNDEKSVRIRLC